MQYKPTIYHHLSFTPALLMPRHVEDKRTIVSQQTLHIASLVFVSECGIFTLFMRPYPAKKFYPVKIFSKLSK